MSSIHKQKGKPNWFCAFYDPEGFRRFRSTETDSRRHAETICTALDHAARLAKQGTNKLTSDKIHKILNGVVDKIGDDSGPLVASRAKTVLEKHIGEFVKRAGGEFKNWTVNGWLEYWLEKQSEIGDSTRAEYRKIASHFAKFLGGRASRALSDVTPVEIEGFKKYMSTRVAPTTVNKALRVTKTAFEDARIEGQIDSSPAERVQFVPETTFEKRMFTLEEVKTLLSVADPEWQTMVMLGFYTGQRLRDCAQLDIAKVYLAFGKIEFRPGKSKKKKLIAQAMAPPLTAYLKTVIGDKTAGPLCPSLCNRKASPLSALFYAVMVKAGIVDERDHRSKGKGRDGKREVAKISFHSLRHTANTLLLEAGVSPMAVRSFIGHESQDMTDRYNHPSFAAMQDTAGKLPNVMK